MNQGSCFEALSVLNSNFEFVWTAPQTWQESNCFIRTNGTPSATLRQLAEQARANGLFARIGSLDGLPWLQIQPMAFQVDSIAFLDGRWRPAKDSVFIPLAKPKPVSYRVAVRLSRIDLDSAKSFGISISEVLARLSLRSFSFSGGIQVDADVRQRNMIDSILREATYKFELVDSASIEIGQEFSLARSTIDYKEGNSVTQYEQKLSGFSMNFFIDSNSVGRYRIQQLGDNKSLVSASMLFGSVRHDFDSFDSMDSVSGWWLFKRKTKIRHRVLYSVDISFNDGLSEATRPPERGTSEGVSGVKRKEEF